MGTFAYQGRDAAGKLVKGRAEADNRKELSAMLLKQKIVPVKIVQTDAEQSGLGQEIEFFAPKVGQDLLIMFCRQMSSLLSSGVPILRALRGLEESTENTTFRKTIKALRNDIDSGRSLAESLRNHPKVFSEYFCSMVSMGEVNGNMDEIFEMMAKHMDFDSYMRGQVKSALRYPTFVVIAMVVAISVLNIFVIPSFAKAFTKLGADLPAITKGLLAFSSFMVNYWWLLLLLLFGAYYLFRLWTNSSIGGVLWDNFLLKAPIVGPLVTKSTLSRFSKSLEMSLKSGVPLVQALDSVSRVIENRYLEREILRMREEIERGTSLLRTARDVEMFSPLLLQMIAVGEETGNIDGMLGQIGDMYRREVEYELEGLSAKIEPILMIFMGGLVLLLALGIFLPMWNLSSASLKKQ